MDFSPLFVRDPTFAHLNAGTRTRVPLAVLDFMERERREGEKNPTKTLFTGYDRIWEAQKRLAAFLGASPHDLFLRGNVTSAFNDFLFALPPLGPGEVVATGWEYGGTLGLLRHWAGLAGLAFRSVPLPLRPDWTEESLAAAVLAGLRPETRLLLLSHVATGTGAVLPVGEIARKARALGVLTVVDGAHAVGAIPVSLGALEADFYGGNFHKWFLGPEGTGFGWVHPRWREKLAWKFGGWASEAPPAFYQGFGDRDPETCRRFFPGTIDRIPFLGLGETCTFWEHHGAASLRARQTELRELARAQGLALGWEERSPVRPELRGPLVSFVRPGAWVGEATALATRLYREARVQLMLTAVQGEPLVRLSPGVYATDGEVFEAFERLGAWRP
jgi:isopenicillin-N epimerase